MSQHNDSSEVVTSTQAVATVPSEFDLAEYAKRLNFPIKSDGALSLYHLAAKKIPKENLSKAEENKPFSGIVRAEKDSSEATDMIHKAREYGLLYLTLRYPSLKQLGFFLGIPDSESYYAEILEREESIIQEMSQELSAIKMVDHLEELKLKYSEFKGVREMLTFLTHRGLMRPNTILKTDYLADLLVAAPVWFIWAKDIDLSPNILKEGDPSIDPAQKFISGLGKTQSFTDLFLMFNRRTRPFSTYKGDTIPPHIIGLITEAQKHFDLLIIATPYHNIASNEWVDPNWKTLIDPFLIGINQASPDFMFFLGRWSDTGIFPLVDEMVADTMDFIKTNLSRLLNFGDNPWWYMPEGVNDNNYAFKGIHGQRADKYLPDFARKLIEEYEKGTLFDFLKSE